MLVPQGSWLAAIYVLGGIGLLGEIGSSSVLLYACPPPIKQSEESDNSLGALHVLDIILRQHSAKQYVTTYLHR